MMSATRRSAAVAERTLTIISKAKVHLRICIPRFAPCGDRLWHFRPPANPSPPRERPCKKPMNLQREAHRDEFTLYCAFENREKRWSEFVRQLSRQIR